MTQRDFLRRIIAALEQSGIPYMLVGSLASALHGVVTPYDFLTPAGFCFMEWDLPEDMLAPSPTIVTYNPSEANNDMQTNSGTNLNVATIEKSRDRVAFLSALHNTTGEWVRLHATADGSF